MSEIVIFGDGACRGNPGPGGWGFLLITDELFIEKGGRADRTTNNEMEITSLLESLKLVRAIAEEGSLLKFYFDSQYVLKGASAWIWSWLKSGWKTKSGEEVKNKELWKQIAEILSSLKKKVKIDWYYIEGHSGNAGNDRVDEIATSFADEMEVYLEDGKRNSEHQKFWEAQRAGRDIREISSIGSKSSATVKKNVYYLSFVGGQVYRDESWASCEARVKGVAGAKYKKISSSSEEKEILKKWGYNSSIS